MQGKVKVTVEYEVCYDNYMNGHFIEKDCETECKSYMVNAWADVESSYDEGYGDRAGSYHDEYDNITIDEETLSQLVFDDYGDIDYTYTIDEDSFE
jgi:hypothetical protein